MTTNDQLEKIKNWLAEQAISYQRIKALNNDASFRHYYRLTEIIFYHSQTKYSSLILVDSPPQKEKNCQFIKISNKFSQTGINSVNVIKANHNQGFFLLNDLGDLSLFDLHKNIDFADKTISCYYQALKILNQFEAKKDALSKDLNHYNKKLVEEELSLFSQWFIEKTLATIDKNLIPTWQKMQKQLWALISHQFLQSPTSFTHRDFHSKNLMVIKKNKSLNLAVIDFQDAVIGPALYDLISLVNDSYIQIPQSILEDLIKKAYQIYHPYFNDYNQFLENFHYLNIQRKLKVIGIFCRLNLRDNKNTYLKYIPLTLHYLSQSCAYFYPLKDFHYFLTQSIIPSFRQYMQHKQSNYENNATSSWFGH